MGVGSADHDVSLQSSVSDLTADVSVGGTDDHPVLGGVVLVLVLDDQTLAGEVVSPALSPGQQVAPAFKVVVAAAALESGEFTPQSVIPGPQTYTLPGTSTKVRNASRTACSPIRPRGAGR